MARLKLSRHLGHLKFFFSFFLPSFFLNICIWCLKHWGFLPGLQCARVFFWELHSTTVSWLLTTFGGWMGGDWRGGGQDSGWSSADCLHFPEREALSGGLVLGWPDSPSELGLQRPFGVLFLPPCHTCSADSKLTRWTVDLTDAFPFSPFLKVLSPYRFSFKIYVICLRHLFIFHVLVKIFFFVEIKNTWHFDHLKVYNSIVLSIFTLCNRSLWNFCKTDCTH